MEWIDVNIELPNEVLGNYLVCLRNNGVFIAHYSNMSTRGFWKTGRVGFVEGNPITHWAELPEGANEID